MDHISFTPFPVLETERLLLRRVERSDAKYIFRLRSDETYCKFTGIKKYKDINEAIKYIDRIHKDIESKECILWSICSKDTNEFIGGISLWDIKEEEKQSEIGYDLLPEFRGEGYIQEAIKVVISYAFNELNFRKIVAKEVRTENIKSMKVLEESGFEVIKKYEVVTEDGNEEERADHSLLKNRF
ncbi:GNAT family N-acetyltransferase [Clostridium sp. YIM B02551]|uniref:GNAT family N-acetyltransferase n=1 Tax=Clostridium sp. YIM B02551 TaxID=2910679 RepID=UPI001EEC8376|nr:GNAT family N-acetyltransferase [Clostridium sp. YIM B02551]